MHKFYATGINKEGKQVIVYGETPFASRLEATQQAERIAKVRELKIDGVNKVQGTERGGNYITKFAKLRKQNKGQNPASYHKAL